MTEALPTGPMETINGCTVIPPSDSPEPAAFGHAEMDGAYRVLVVTVPAGEPAPPFHVHPDTDEAFYVAEGEAGFLLGDRETHVTAGGFVFVPRGTPHTAWNAAGAPLRGLILISPGDAEHVAQRAPAVAAQLPRSFSASSEGLPGSAV